MKMFLSRFVVPGMALVALSCSEHGGDSADYALQCHPGTGDPIDPGHGQRDEDSTGGGEARSIEAPLELTARNASA